MPVLSSKTPFPCPRDERSAAVGRLAEIALELIEDVTKRRRDTASSPAGSRMPGRGPAPGLNTGPMPRITARTALEWRQVQGGEDLWRRRIGVVGAFLRHERREPGEVLSCIYCLLSQLCAPIGWDEIEHRLVQDTAPGNDPSAAARVQAVSRPDRRRLELGLNLPYVEGSMDGRTPRWTDILAMAQTAEAIGFDALWVSDHVGFGDPEGEWRGAWESWTLLSALAASTSRVALGPYVLAVPLRNPALLAKMAETLDEVSGGRLILGLGAGWNEPEFTSYGLPFEDRFRRFEDGLRVITDMLRTRAIDARRPDVRTRSARLEPRGPRPDGPAGDGRRERPADAPADRGAGRSLERRPALDRRGAGTCSRRSTRPVARWAGIRRRSRSLSRSSCGLAAADDAPPEEREIRGDRRPSPPSCVGSPTWASTISRSSSARIRSRVSRRSRPSSSVCAPLAERVARRVPALRREVGDRDLDHRRPGRHLVEVLVAPGVGHDPLRDGAAFGVVGDDPGRGRQVRLNRPALRWTVRCGSASRLAIQARFRSAGRAGDDQPAVDVVEHDLDPARLVALPPRWS